MAGILLVGVMIGVYFNCFKDEFKKEEMEKLAIVPVFIGILLVIVIILGILGVI